MKITNFQDDLRVWCNDLVFRIEQNVLGYVDPVKIVCDGQNT